MLSTVRVSLARMQYAKQWMGCDADDDSLETHAHNQCHTHTSHGDGTHSYSAPHSVSCQHTTAGPTLAVNMHHPPVLLPDPSHTEGRETARSSPSGEPKDLFAAQGISADSNKVCWIGSGVGRNT